MRRVAQSIVAALGILGCQGPEFVRGPISCGPPMPPTLRGAIGPWGEPVTMVPPVGPHAPGAQNGLGPEVPRAGGIQQAGYSPIVSQALSGVTGVPASSPALPPGVPTSGLPAMHGAPPLPGVPAALPGAGTHALVPGAVPPIPSMMVPQGQVYAPGALNLAQPPFAIRRSQVYFAAPKAAKIGWYAQSPTHDRDGRPILVPYTLDIPGRYNFIQGAIYRIKLYNIPGRPGLELYPTLEVVPSNPKTEAFLAHNAIPVEFTDEDFDQVLNGNFITKVIYLPDPRFQGPLGAGPEELTSTRLEPGQDPIAEAYKRGHILLVVRMGGIQLETPNSPPLDNPGPYGPPQPPQPQLPPGVTPPVPAGKPSAPPLSAPQLPRFNPPTQGPPGPIVPANSLVLPEAKSPTPTDGNRKGDVTPVAYQLDSQGQPRPVNLRQSTPLPYPMTTIPREGGSQPPGQSMPSRMTDNPAPQKPRRGLLDSLLP
ncbi:MAG: hypothetical protein RMI91_10695 [Gemmatales bacterium]|nr:hypothetical protein [Gemmatales bacterium]MDW7995111.1 hypothetical protein [Gemmatales bacterium]